MKRGFAWLLILVLLVSGIAFSEEAVPYESIDEDLTDLMDIMVYSYLFDMEASPKYYVGKVIRFRGVFNFEKDGVTGECRYFCRVVDEAGCCSINMEFLPQYYYLSENFSFPRGEEDCIVTGLFEAYMDEETHEQCFRIMNATFEQ